MTKKILIIIPCFNEEQNIVSVIEELDEIRIENMDIEILPINDASPDNTLKKITSITKNYLNLSNNLGIGGAVQSGFKFAKANNFDYAIQVDGDAQHPPKEIYKIINTALEHNADLCIGSRYINKEGFQSSGLRQFGIKFLNFLILLCTKCKIHDSNYYPDKYPEPESIVYCVLHQLKVIEIAVNMKERKGGISSITGLSTLYYMTKVSLAILFLKLNHLIKK
jgi:glycosyltransferase involved in cell wall biosynthesis